MISSQDDDVPAHIQELIEATSGELPTEVIQPHAVSDSANVFCCYWCSQQEEAP